MQILFPRECWTQSFYTPAFYTSSPKIRTSLDVYAEAGLSCKLHAQAFDEASGLFHTTWKEASFSAASRSIAFSDQIVFTADAVSVYTAPLMRWWVEMSGTGSITMAMSVFELTSTRQAA